jgi:hypothetical protein
MRRCVVTARTPAQIAEAGAESIRQLNHALYADLAYPGDAYSIVGNLTHLASMLPQALTMIRGAVQKLERGGGLYSDHDDLADDLDRAYEGLEQAANDAQTLYESIGRAHAGLGHIGTQDGGEES